MTRVIAEFFEVVGLFERWAQSCLLTYATSVREFGIFGSVGAWNEVGTQ